jgi:hypothetical protein
MLELSITRSTTGRWYPRQEPILVARFDRYLLDMTVALAALLAVDVAWICAVIRLRRQ